VFSALGFYPVTPGTDEYVFGSPLFPKVTLTFENGRKLIIEAPGNNKENIYVSKIQLNGKVLDRNFIKHKELQDGGRMIFDMSGNPDKVRAISKESAPYSMSRTAK